MKEAWGKIEAIRKEKRWDEWGRREDIDQIRPMEIEYHTLTRGRCIGENTWVQTDRNSVRKAKHTIKAEWMMDSMSKIQQLWKRWKNQEGKERTVGGMDEEMRIVVSLFIL